MRFLLDMGISSETAGFLRSLDHDAVHLRDVNLQRLPDPDILQKALDEDRILITHDLGFSDLLAVAKFHIPAVVIFRLRDMRPANVNRHLRSLITAHGDLMKTSVIISVSEARIRIRPLPLDQGESD